MKYKFFTKLTLLSISLFVLSSFFMSCDRNIAVTGVSLDKQNLTLEVGQKKSLTAVITPVEATNQNMTWSSRNTNIATVNETGVVKAVSPGKTIILVTTEDGGFTAFCSVTVNEEKEDNTVHVTDVLLDRYKCIMGVGQQCTLVATVIPDSVRNRNVIWSSDNPGIATVDETGTVTAIATGQTRITVTTRQDHITATCEVEVSEYENIALYFDPKFAAKLKEMGYIDDADFFSADLVNNIKELNLDETKENKAANKVLSSIRGISYFTALEKLSCRNNNLDSLYDITQTQMSQLKELNLSNNNFSSLDVSNCTSLKILYVDSCQLTSLNVRGCTVLLYLHCRDNNLTTLNLSGCASKLYSLKCSDNSLTTLDLSGCTELRSFYCSGNNLTTLNLSSSKWLSEFGCGDNKNLTTLNLSGCGELRTIACWNCNLSSLNLSSIHVNDWQWYYLNCTGNPGSNGEFVVTVYAKGCWQYASCWSYNGQTVCVEERLY